MSFVGAVIDGVLLGGYYAMIACGLSFMFGVMKIINLAHGSLAIVAGFALWLIADRLDYDPFLALIVVLPAMGALGWLLQRGVLERSARSGELAPILSTFGLAIVVENALFECFGADTRSLAPSVGSLSYDSLGIGGGLYVGKLAILTFAVAILLLGGLKYSSPILPSDAKFAPRQRIPTPSSSSASIPGLSTPSPRQLRLLPSRSRVCFSACERPSTRTQARCSLFSRLKRQSSAALEACGVHCAVE